MAMGWKPPPPQLLRKQHLHSLIVKCSWVAETARLLIFSFLDEARTSTVAKRHSLFSKFLEVSKADVPFGVSLVVSRIPTARIKFTKI